MTMTEHRDIILVVDDSPDTLSLINDALEASGYEVLVALEGRQALKITSRIAPDLILMDAVMPNMDGFETCRQLKARNMTADIPVIFMTGLDSTGDVVRGLDCGGVDYLTKPVAPDELLARIRVHLRNARISSTAHSVLDQSGQPLMILDESGSRVWATPGAIALLARAGVTDPLWENHVCGVWASFLRQGRQHLELRCSDYPLSLNLLRKEPAGWLVQLQDGQRPVNEKLLQHQLNLTERESEVLFWIANGKTNREIATILEVSPRTVNKHLEQIFPKLGVSNRTSAAAAALKVLAKEA